MDPSGSAEVVASKVQVSSVHWAVNAAIGGRLSAGGSVGVTWLVVVLVAVSSSVTVRRTV